MLGFTKLESIQTLRHPRAKLCLLGISTIVVLLVILDSFLLHRPEISSLISPLQRHDVQSCEMSYAYPTFYEIDHQKIESVLSQKYKLFLYREGNLDDPNKLYGTPALFIPGQAGSHKQVRSIASETTRLFHSSQAKQNIDFFTVDLNEELSALDGPTLLDQAEYTNKAIKFILSLYTDYPSPPTSVLIIGHSMGGIVARTSFMLPSYVPSSIDTIVTLATPHLSAPLLLDSKMYTVYRNLVQFWTDNQDTLLSNVTLVSIAGGSLDNIVNSDTASIQKFIPETHGFTTYTTSIPGVWTGADHMAILWCNQLIRILASTLLQVTDAQNNPERRVAIFRANLMDRVRDSRNQEQSEFSTQSIEEKRIMSLEEDKEVKILFEEEKKFIVLLPASTQRAFGFLTNIPVEYDSCWSLSICSAVDADEHVCKSTAANISILPSAIATNLAKSTPYRHLAIDSQAIPPNSFIGVTKTCNGPISLEESEEKAMFVLSHISPTQSELHMNSVWDIIWNGVTFSVNSTRSSHAFPYLRNSLFAFDIHVLSIQGNKSPLFPAMIKQTSDRHDAKFYRNLQQGVSDRMTFHQSPNADSAGVLLEFFMDNQSLVIQMRFDWYGTLGRCALRYGILLLHFLKVITCTVLCTQLYSYIQPENRREFQSFPYVFLQCLSGPFLQLAQIIVVAGALQCILFRYSNHIAIREIYSAILVGADEWIMVGVVLFFFALSAGCTLIIWSVIHLVTTALAYWSKSLSTVKPILSLQQQAIILVAVTLNVIQVVPPSIIIVGYILVWLILTSVARADANLYYYRQAWLLFVISLLPKHISQVITYAKNLAVGWTVIPSASWQEVLTIAFLITLVTVGRTPIIIEQKRIALFILYLLNSIVFYQTLFGFVHPFILAHFDRQLKIEH